MRDLGFLPNGVEFSRGFYLNAKGIVTGESDNDISKTFIFDPDIDAMTALFDLIISNPDNMNIAGGFGASINNSDQIVGSMSRFTAPTSSVVRGFIFEAGAVRDLGSIDGLTTTPARAWGINNSGVVVGLSRNANGVSHATFWKNGAAIDLGSLGGAMAFSEAFRINDRGQAVGRSTVVAGVTGQNAVLWENGSIRDLGRFPGLNFARANDINEKGLIVGTVTQFEGFSGRAAIWRQGEITPTDLNTLLPANSGWTLLTSAEGLNDHGQIVGFGTINGQTRAFLMTPYDIALQDKRRGVTVLVNSHSGDYRIINCSNGAVVDGRGRIESNNCVVILRDPFAASGLHLIFNFCHGVGAASIRTTDKRPLIVVDIELGTSQVTGTCD
jgi:probable HAF family extracellular repeat protein